MRLKSLLPIFILCSLLAFGAWVARCYHDSNASAGDVVVDLQRTERGPLYVVFLAQTWQENRKWSIPITVNGFLTILQDQAPKGWRAWHYSVQGGHVQQVVLSEDAGRPGLALRLLGSRSVPIQRKPGDSGPPEYSIYTLYYGTEEEVERYIHEPSRVVPSAYFKDIVEVESRIRAAYSNQDNR